MTCQFVAPVEVAGHATGGAIDLTLMKDGKEVDMGTEYNDEPSPPEYRTYFSCGTISEEAAGNRRLLHSSLQRRVLSIIPRNGGTGPMVTDTGDL